MIHGIDVGGASTDVVRLDDAGRVRIQKVLIPARWDVWSKTVTKMAGAR